METYGGLTRDEALRWTHIGALAALAMLLGYLETFVPIPVPGLKLGLANVAVLVALAEGDLPGAWWVAAVKVLASGLLFGSPVTMAYSAVGTALSLALMAPLSRLRTMRLTMVSVVGALAHEVGQLLVAQALLGTGLVWYGAPPLLLAGCATGALCGMVATRAVTLLHEAPPQTACPQPDAQAMDVPNEAQVTPSTRPASEARAASRPGRGSSLAALVALVLFSVVVLHLTDLGACAAALAVGLAACVAVRTPPRKILRALTPVVPLALVTCVAQALFAPGGTPLLSLGGLVITREAVVQALASLLRLAALVTASTAFMASQTTEALFETAGMLLAPARACGLRLEGPALAVRVALKLLPELASGSSREGAHLRTQLGAKGALDAFPQLVVRLYARAEGLAPSYLPGVQGALAYGADKR